MITHAFSYMQKLDLNVNAVKAQEEEEEEDKQERVVRANVGKTQ